MKIDYFTWAEKILQELYDTPEGSRVLLLASHLTTAGKQGFKDGTDTGWAYEQDKALKSHEGMCRCSYERN